MKKEILDLFESIKSPIEKEIFKSQETDNFLESLKRANESYISMSFENMEKERRIQQINSEYSKNYLLG